MIKCSKCGAELSDDAKFCSYCGNKIEVPTPSPIIEEEPQIDEVPHSSEFVENEPEPSNTANAKKGNETKSFTDKIKAKGIEFWNKRSVYGKIVTVALVVVILLALIAFLAGKTMAAVIAVLQMALVVVSILMHKGVIKLEPKNSWLKYLVLVVAILLTVLNIMTYSWGQGNKPGNEKTYQAPVNDTSDLQTDPIITTALSPVAASECIGADFSSIRAKFYTAGFTNIKVEKVEDLKSSEADKLDTVESISVNGSAEFTQGQEFEKTDEIVIRYHVYEKCAVTIHVDFVPNLIFSTYDVEFLWNGINKGTMEHGEDQDFQLTVDPGEYTITFESAKSSSVDGEVSLNVDCDVEAAYKISCHSDKVSVETLYVDRLVELAEGEVKIDVSASEYNHANYEDVATALKAIGFTNIKYNVLYDIVFGWTDEGEVESVSIAGNIDYKRGDVFKEDAEVIITYHMPENADPSNITMNESSGSFDGMDYLEVEKAFKNLGFTNITLESTTIKSNSHTDGEVSEVEIDGHSFDSGDVFKPDEKVVIKYYIVEEPEPNLTVENCPELAAILSNKAEIDASYSAFASKYKGRIIEFDGRIDYSAKHENFKTRFDYLMSAGDYDPDHQIGPSFKFEDVSYSDLHTDLDTVSVGLNVRIVAKVVSFNSNTGLFYLEPVSVTGR